MWVEEDVGALVVPGVRRGYEERFDAMLTPEMAHGRSKATYHAEALFLGRSICFRRCCNS